MYELLRSKGDLLKRAVSQLPFDPHENEFYHEVVSEVDVVAITVMKPVDGRHIVVNGDIFNRPR